jgi:MATE family multidrug resistance protein
MTGGKAQGVETGDRSALREMLVVALPAVVTMTSYTAMQFVDTVVVSRLGPEAVAATGNGGIAAFVPASIMFGIVSMVNTFVSQHLGAGHPERGAAYAWNAMWLTVAMWAVVLVPYAVAMPWVFGAMRTFMRLAVDPEVARLELEYGRILVLGMVITIAARGLSHYFYGMHRPKVVMFSALLGNAVNIPVSIVLVFGWMGVPALGVAGAAIGTVVGGLVELVIPMVVFLRGDYAAKWGSRASWRPDAGKMREIVKIGWPAGAMWGNEILCWWVFMAGLNATFGIAHNTAGWMVLRYMHLSFMPAVGLSIAVTAVVGKQIGAGRPDLVRSRTWLGMKVAMVYMGVCAVVMVVFRNSLIGVFLGASEIAPEMRAEVMSIGATLLIVAAAFQVFDAMAITLSGALRGAGDTLWPGVVMIVLNWVCIIGLGYALVVWAPGLKSLGPWLGAAAYIVLLAVAYLWRFESGAWKRIRLVDQPVMPAGGHAGEGIVPELPGVDAADGVRIGPGSGAV